MTEEKTTKLQVFRTVLEGVSVALILWVASTLSGVKVDIAVVNAQVAALNAAQGPLATDVQLMKQEQAIAKTEREALKSDVRELKQVRNLPR